MPVSLPNLIRGVIMLLLAVHAFVMYSTARALSETVGFDAGSVLVSVLFAAVLMLPFVWAYGLADLPAEDIRHVRPKRRWKRGDCPACGYHLHGIRSAACPECGDPVAEPESHYQFGWNTVRRFLILVGLSLLIGSAAGEISILQDEAAFRREVDRRAENGVDGSYSRPRRWPNESAGLVYTPAEGVTAHD